ncbi:unnamed protein product [Orchesella dallaii]|uniref:Uncharacterized protein n=1 Tax=Orchesella dallaii TaxID=48710 RepID=A0ABP1PHR2_9HEXA
MGSELDLTCLESLEKEVTLNSGMDVDPVDDNDNDNHCNELDLDITVELSSTNGKDGNDSQLSSATTIGSMTFASQHEVEDRIPQRLTETDKPEGKDTDGEDFAAEVDIEVELEPEDNRPVISVRNFAEIAENDDEEDGASDDDDIFIIEEVSLNRNEISASDLKRMSLDLTVEEEMHDLGSFYRVVSLKSE